MRSLCRIGLFHWLLIGLAFGLLTGVAQADSWPMLGRDMQHTGRADYAIPESRLNSGLFDVFRWQTPAPGPVGSSSMVFTDRPGQIPEGVVAAGYHWPKGVQVMDRHTGAVLWATNPGGGERIGDFTPAFSPDGESVYVINDATNNATWPNGHPLMALDVDGGGGSFRHNGLMADPSWLSGDSPTIAPDGRIFAKRPGGGGRPAAAWDTGSQLDLAWSGQTLLDCVGDPTLFYVGDQLRVVIGGQDGWIRCYDGTTGAQIWQRSVGCSIRSTITVDPATGNMYVPGVTVWEVEHEIEEGWVEVIRYCNFYIIGLRADGENIAGWGSAEKFISQMSGNLSLDNVTFAISMNGCLSHDGDTYYFSNGGDFSYFHLYSINTSTGTTRWSFENYDWFSHVSPSPIVTTNDIIICGTGSGFIAIRDNLNNYQIVDSVNSNLQNNDIVPSPSMGDDGLLYLPVRRMWTVPNGNQPPDGTLRDLFAAIDLSVNPYSVQPACQPVTDVALPWSGFGTTVGAPDVIGGPAGEVAYRFTLAEPMDLQVSTCLAGTALDTETWLYTGQGPCDGGTQLLFDEGDPACGYRAGASSWRWTEHSAELLPAGVYTLVVSGADNLEGEFQLSLEAWVPELFYCQDFADGLDDFSVLTLEPGGNSWGISAGISGHPQTAYIQYNTLGQEDHSLLISPVVDCSGVNAVELSFWHYLVMGYSGAWTHAYVRGSIDGGQTWPHLLGEWHADGTGGVMMVTGVETLDLTPWAAGQSQVRLQFEFHDLYDYFWHVDDICLSGSTQASLAAPQVAVAVAGADLELTWPAVPGAQSYRVLESPAPYGEYLPVATVAEPAWTAAGVAESTPRFYQVVADSQAPAGLAAAYPVIPRLEPNLGLRALHDGEEVRKND